MIAYRVYTHFVDRTFTDGIVTATSSTNAIRSVMAVGQWQESQILGMLAISIDTRINDEQEQQMWVPGKNELMAEPDQPVTAFASADAPAPAVAMHEPAAEQQPEQTIPPPVGEPTAS